MITYESIEILKDDEQNDISKLILTTFDKFIATDYSKEGIDTFYNFVNNGNSIKKAVESGEFCIVAKEQNKILGAIVTREKTHISLLFVEEASHGKGVAKNLLKLLTEKLVKDYKILTVNSSPYALGVYEKLGFKATSRIQEKDGIKFIPMKKHL